MNGSGSKRVVAEQVQRRCDDDSTLSRSIEERKKIRDAIQKELAALEELYEQPHQVETLDRFVEAHHQLVELLKGSSSTVSEIYVRSVCISDSEREKYCVRVEDEEELAKK